MNIPKAGIAPEPARPSPDPLSQVPIAPLILLRTPTAAQKPIAFARRAKDVHRVSPKWVTFKAAETRSDVHPTTDSKLLDFQPLARDARLRRMSDMGKS
jgi:hypothetical protein